MAEPYKVMLIDDDKGVHVLMRRIIETPDIDTAPPMTRERPEDACE